MVRKAEQLALGLQRFGLARDRMRAALAKRAAMAASDLDALEFLESQGPLTQRELGDRLSLTSGAVTMLVDRLESAGWVRRRPHPSDRRYTVLELSPEAVNAAPVELAEFHRAVRALAAAVPAAQVDVVTAFLAAAAEAAETAASGLQS